MEELQQYLELLPRFVGEVRAVDLAHNMFLFGAVVSRKPQHVLEMGIGTGYLTASLIHAIRYNRKGDLTCVDNWFDWRGREPEFVSQIRAAQGVQVVAPMDEQTFLQSAPDNAYDVVVSDADHFRSHSWVEEYCRVTSPDGFIFFHDTNNKKFPNLRTIVDRVRDWRLPHYHFTESTRPDENCGRGWLFVINRKPRPAP